MKLSFVVFSALAAIASSYPASDVKLDNREVAPPQIQLNNQQTSTFDLNPSLFSSRSLTHSDLHLSCIYKLHIQAASPYTDVHSLFYPNKQYISISTDTWYLSHPSGLAVPGKISCWSSLLTLGPPHILFQAITICKELYYRHLKDISFLDSAE